jgi:hypothetical protein
MVIGFRVQKYFSESSVMYQFTLNTINSAGVYIPDRSFASQPKGPTNRKLDPVNVGI